jgi:hypothetical protein
VRVYLGADNRSIGRLDGLDQSIDLIDSPTNRPVDQSVDGLYRPGGATRLDLTSTRVRVLLLSVCVVWIKITVRIVRSFISRLPPPLLPWYG